MQENKYDVKSNEEKHFIWFLEDLQKYGYIKSFEYEPEALSINDGLYFKTFTKAFKVRQQILIPEKVYTYDFKVVWDKSAYGIFFYDFENCHPLALVANKHLFPAQMTFLCTTDTCETPCDNFECNEYVSHIEVKGNFDVHNMIRLAKSNVAFIWERHKIYIHILEPYITFERFFFPSRFVYTDNNPTRLRVRKGIKVLSSTNITKYVTLMKKLKDDFLTKYNKRQAKKRDSIKKLNRLPNTK
jgi:hypothetical protein